MTININPLGKRRLMRFVAFLIFFVYIIQIVHAGYISGTLSDKSLIFGQEKDSNLSEEDTLNITRAANPVNLPISGPTITSITPKSGVNTGNKTVTITGTKFQVGTNIQGGTKVNLTRTGQANIIATGVTVPSSTQINCTLPLTGKATGTWNVVVTTGGQNTTKANAFTITSPASSPDNIGVFRNKTWSVDYNGNGYWNSGDKTAKFGVGDGKDKPVTGDWNGNGKTNIGVVRGKTWYVDYNGNGYWDAGDKTATFGVGDGKDIPVTGDWYGNGKTNIGVVRGKTWYIDYNGNGYWDAGDKTATFGVGDGKDIPVTGDWNGNGKTNIGVVRGKTWYVDYNGNGYWDAGDKTATFGVGDGIDMPVVGKWSGTGVGSDESVGANKVQEPESPIQPPIVTRTESDIPRVEMPVKSSPVVSPISGGGVVPPQNPLVSGGGVRASGIQAQ
jgi:hypothetical protein